MWHGFLGSEAAKHNLEGIRFCFWSVCLERRRQYHDRGNTSSHLPTAYEYEMVPTAMVKESGQNVNSSVYSLVRPCAFPSNSKPSTIRLSIQATESALYSGGFYNSHHFSVLGFFGSGR